MARAEELEVALPDGLVLLTVLNKIAEAVGKAGAQASFRISSVRQELQVDVRPHLAKIKQFSEYLQAEAEELSLATALKTSSTTNAANPTQQAPGLKALATSGAKDPVAETGARRKGPSGHHAGFGAQMEDARRVAVAATHIRGTAWRRTTGASDVLGWATRSGIARSRNGTGARARQQQRPLPRCPSLRSRRMQGLREKALAQAVKGPDRLAHRAPRRRRPGRSPVGFPTPHRRIRWPWVEEHLIRRKMPRRQQG